MLHLLNSVSQRTFLISASVVSLPSAGDDSSALEGEGVIPMTHLELSTAQSFILCINQLFVSTTEIRFSGYGCEKLSARYKLFLFIVFASEVP